MNRVCLCIREKRKRKDLEESFEKKNSKPNVTNAHKNDDDENLTIVDGWMDGRMVKLFFCLTRLGSMMK